jgi:hypothetical protein
MNLSSPLTPQSSPMLQGGSITGMTRTRYNSKVYILGNITVRLLYHVPRDSQSDICVHGIAWSSKMWGHKSHGHASLD